jgi:hypothetical protein
MILLDITCSEIFMILQINRNSFESNRSPKTILKKPAKGKEEEEKKEPARTWSSHPD